MIRDRLGFLRGLVVVLAGLAGLLAGAALAQIYPPPVGSLTFTASTTAPTVGSPVTLTATVVDNQGQPIANADVLFRFVQRPSSDTTLEGGVVEAIKKTDTLGVASVQLNPGSKAGTVIVESVSGEKTSRLTISVQAAGAPPGLPPTGGAPAEEGGGVQVWLIALLAGGAALAGGGLLVLARRRIKS